jgi:hypothetical protein
MERKTFKIKEGDGKEVTLAIKMPHAEDLQEANQVYTTKIASLIRGSGSRQLLTRQLLNEFLKNQKIWTDEDEKKVQVLQVEIDGLLSKLRKGGIKLAEVRALCIETMDKRSKMVDILRQRQMFDDATIESVAEAERMDYLIYTCTVYADSGRSYWDSFEDMQNDKLSEAYRRASLNAARVVFDIDPEFEKNLPENKLLKKYGFIDENLNYVDRKTGEKVDREGKPVKQLEDTAQEKLDNLQGEITEEVPFVDDETGEPVIVSENVKEEEKEEVTT